MAVTTISGKLFATNHTGFFTHIVDNEPVCYHKHDFYEIFYIVRGTANHLVNGVKQKLQAGDLIICAKDTEHMFFDTDKTDCLRRDIAIFPELFQTVANYISPNFIGEYIEKTVPTVYKMSQHRISACEKYLNTISSKQQKEPEKAMQLIRVFLANLLDVCLLSDINIVGRHPWLNDIIAKLHETKYFHESIPDLLRDYTYNISYIQKTFKQYTGMSITEFRIQSQIEYAKTLLLTTDKTIEEIAELCGFLNVTYFYRTFKKHIGTTPKKYRSS